MKKSSGKAHHMRFIGVMAVGFMIFIFCGIVKADNVITAELKAAPTANIKPGDVVKFQADVIYNPAFDEPAGKRMRIFVTRSDFSWVSDKLDIEYPGMGSVHVDFKNGFSIPADAKVGQVFDFYLVYGPWWTLSNKASVTVTRLAIKVKSKKFAKAVQAK